MKLSFADFFVIFYSLSKTSYGSSCCDFKDIIKCSYNFCLLLFQQYFKRGISETM